MTGGGVEVVTVGAVGIAFVAAAALVLGHRARRRRTARLEAEVRPVLFGALDAGDIDPTSIDALRPASRRALAAQARALLPSLRGNDKDTLGRLLDRLGTVDVARRQSRSRRADVRARAGEFLGDAGAPAALRDLLDLLHDPNPEVRWSAARGLGRLGDPSALSPLLASLEGPRPLPVDVVADAIFQIRRCPVSLLRQGLRSLSVPTRAVAVELLGRFQALAAADEVVQALKDDPSVEVRARAARALGRMGSPCAVDALLASLDGGAVAMRVQAVWALGEIGGSQAVPALGGILMEPSRQLGELAAQSLLAIGRDGMRTLQQIAAGAGQPAAIAAGALAGRPNLALTSP